MVCVLCVVGTLGVIGLALLFRAAATAPQGGEDAQGFHLTGTQKPSGTKEAPLSASDLAFFVR